MRFFKDILLTLLPEGLLATKSHHLLQTRADFLTKSKRPSGKLFLSSTIDLLADYLWGEITKARIFVILNRYLIGDIDCLRHID